MGAVDLVLQFCRPAGGTYGIVCLGTLDAAHRFVAWAYDFFSGAVSTFWFLGALVIGSSSEVMALIALSTEWE